MKIGKQDLIHAQDAGIIASHQTEKLYDFLQALPSAQSRFNLANLLYYLGAIIAISGASVLITQAWKELGGLGIFLISLSLQSLVIFIAEYWHRQKNSIAAGLTAAITIALTPLTLYGLLEYLGFWPDSTDYKDYHHLIDYRWLALELGTITVNILVLLRYRLSFFLLPLAATLWYMSMDVSPALIELFNINASDNKTEFEIKSLVSAIFGGFVFICGYIVQRFIANSKDYSFWLFLPAILALLGGLFCWVYEKDIELLKFTLFSFEIGLIFIGLRLKQPVISIFASLAAWGYLAYLAHDVFESAISYNLFLVFSGLLLIWLGSYVYKKQRQSNQIQAAN